MVGQLEFGLTSLSVELGSRPTGVTAYASLHAVNEFQEFSVRNALFPLRIPFCFQSVETSISCRLYYQHRDRIASAHALSGSFCCGIIVAVLVDSSANAALAKQVDRCNP